MGPSERIGDVVLIASAVPAVLSVLVFARVNWRATPLGVHVMSYMVVMAAVLGLGVVRIFIGHRPIFEVVRVAALCGVPVVMWWRLLVLVQAQRRRDRFNQPGHQLGSGPDNRWHR